MVDSSSSTLPIYVVVHSEHDPTLHMEVEGVNIGEYVEVHGVEHGKLPCVWIAEQVRTAFVRGIRVYEGVGGYDVLPLLWAWIWTWK